MSNKPSSLNIRLYCLFFKYITDNVHLDSFGETFLSLFPDY